MMAHQGLAKLVEECGEVAQVAGKMLAYPAGPHPDGKGDLRVRLEGEISDLLAACLFAVTANGLDEVRIRSRMMAKLQTFARWHADPAN